MIANALTKHDPNDQSLWDLLTEGWWSIHGETRIRYTARVQDFDEDDLHDMQGASTKQRYRPDDGEMLVYHHHSTDQYCLGLRLSSHNMFRTDHTGGSVIQLQSDASVTQLTQARDDANTIMYSKDVRSTGAAKSKLVLRSVEVVSLDEMD